MPIRVVRAFVALAVGPWLVLSAAIPPEHVHEADGNHRDAVVHRHAESHAVDVRHDDGAAFDHDEERVVWLTDFALIRAAYQSAILVDAGRGSWETVGDSTTWVACPSHDEPPPHGPPRRCVSLRAPPHPAV